MKVDYQIFPKEIIEEQFNKILDTCTSGLEHEEIMQRIHEILVNRIMPVTINDKADEHLTIWRITDPYDGFDPENKKSYVNPPSIDNKGKKCSRQRANIEGHPVFYTSIDPLTSLTEMKGKLGIKKKFFVSRWKLKFIKPVILHQLVFNSQTNEDGNALKEYTHVQELKWNNALEEIPIKFQEGFNYALLKLGDLFATPSEKLYHITSAYAHDVLYKAREKGVKIDGITYPSVENNNSSLNIAWHPDIVTSECLTLEEVFECQIGEDNLKNEKQSVEIIISRKGVFINDTFSHWESPFLKIIEVIWSDLQIKTFSGFVLKGEEALNTMILDREICTKDFLDEHIYSDAFQEILNQHSDSNPKQEMLSTHELIFEKHVIMIANHGNQIMTPKGKQCIEIFTVPIKWSKSHKPIILPQ
jgi:hypothetical protein